MSPRLPMPGPSDSKRDNVIHVVFGRDGTATRVDPVPLPPEDGLHGAPTETVTGILAPQPSRDPLGDLYSTKEVAKLFEISESRLRGWARRDFVAPSVTLGSRRYYTFQDLISLRVAKGLLDEGIPLREVRDSVDAIRDSLPKVTRPLAELRVTGDLGSVVVRDRRGAFNPSTGQQVIDFEVESLRDDVVQRLRQGPTDAERKSAYEHYLEGCRLDEDEATFERAEAAYRRALQFDPSLSNAHTNLGNLCYRRGRVEEAREHYRNALQIDGDQPEAHYNLGFLALEAGDPIGAIESFLCALETDPAFADAHFNLAMAYEETGQADAARPHWETYLTLEPTGTWAAIAERYLSGDRP